MWRVYRVNFQREASIMSCLDDANITRLLGVCFTDDPVCLVLEYHKFGDLKRFLRRHVIDGSLTQRSSADTLRSDRMFYSLSIPRAFKWNIEAREQGWRECSRCTCGHFDLRSKCIYCSRFVRGTIWRAWGFTQLREIICVERRGLPIILYLVDAMPTMHIHSFIQ